MKLNALAKRMILAIIAITSACTVVALIYYRSLEFFPFFFGAILGAAVSIVKVYLLERAVNLALEPGKANATAYIGLQQLLRFILSGLALLAGALIPQINLWGVVAGIFSYQLAVYVARFTTRDSIKEQSKITNTDANTAKESEAAEDQSIDS